MKIQYVIAVHLIRRLTNLYDFRFKWTATEVIGIHPTKAWLSQLVNFKNAIKYRFKLRDKVPSGSMLTLPEPRRTDRENPPTNFWSSLFWHIGMIYMHWIPTGQSTKNTMLRFKGSSGRDSVRRGQHSSNRVSGISTRTMHQSTTPSSSQIIWPRCASRQFLSLPNPDLAPCDFWLFPKFRGCRY